MRPLRKVAWASPGSIAGLLLAPFFRRRSVVRGVMLCEGATWPRRLGFRHRAMTLGHVVVCVDDIDEGCWSHELVHVDQWERWGPAFPPAYLTATLAALVRRKNFYRDNHFEIEARRLAGH
ncbi:MAG: hypothetical protein ACR2H7_01505 [Actinomycetota bacterium]